MVEDNQALYGQLVQMLHEQKLVFEEQAMILRADENDLKLRDQGERPLALDKYSCFGSLGAYRWIFANSD